MRAALTELVEARLLADDVGKDVWQYAIPLARVEKLDIRERHLRWLIDKSYALHALDTTRKGDRERKFAPLPDDHLPSGACLVITDRGLALAAKSFQAQARALDEPIQLPHWDADRRKLNYGRAVVIEIPRAAPNLDACWRSLKGATGQVRSATLFRPIPKAERCSACATPSTPSTSAARPG